MNGRDHQAGPSLPRRSVSSFDIVIAADMTAHGDHGLRIAQEISANFELGYRTGLYHRGSGPGGRRIAPDIQRCVRSNLAEVIEPVAVVEAGLMVDHSPNFSGGSFGVRPAILAARNVLVLHQRSDVEALARETTVRDDRISIAPSNPWIRNIATNARLALPLEPENWAPMARAALPYRSVARINPRPTIGWIGAGDNKDWPDSAADLENVLPTDGSFEVCVLGRPPKEVRDSLSRSSGWSMHQFGDVAIQRFLDLIDILVYFPGSHADSLPDAAIYAAMAMGKIVVLPDRLSPHFGPLARYCDIDEVDNLVRTALIDGNTGGNGNRRDSVRAFVEESARAYRRRLNLLTGKAHSRPRRPAKRRTAERPTALLVASNGIGLGHVSRVLAIARHARETFNPIIVTLSRAVPVIESFGYDVEFIPSQKSTGTDPWNWDRWFATELEALADRYRAGLIAFDGSNAPEGLVRAVAGRDNCRLAWIRRAMWGTAYTGLLKNARWFDVIIEPGEIAADYDIGVTARLPDRVVRVPPIRLLEKRNLLPKKKARSELGLDPDDPAVLVHLGSSVGDDKFRLVGRIVKELQKFPSLQVVVSPWLTGAECSSVWPGVKILRGFPLSQYFNAFDFSIAEAGYNTYHEVISFELPTVFVPNASQGRDDHRARARFAQEHGAAFELPPDELTELGDIVEVLMNDRAREIMRSACRDIRQRNGAADAANALAARLT